MKGQGKGAKGRGAGKGGRGRGLGEEGLAAEEGRKRRKGES